MNYTLHQLKVFVKVAELQSITKASEELFLSQPAVSIQMKKLQDQFEVPLTEVIGRQLYVTDFGKKVVEVSKKILEESELLKTTINEYKGLLTGKIKFSIVSTAKYVLPYFIKDFIVKYPEVEISIDVTNKSRVIQNLQSNTIDFALISVLPEDMKLDKIKLMENHLYMVGPNQKHASSKFNLKKSPLIFREEGSATRAAMESFLKKRDVKYNKTLELVSNEAIKQSIVAGLGYSVMPVIGLKNELQNGSIEIINQKGLPIITEWYVVYNSGKQFTPATKKMIEVIEENKNKVVGDSFGWEDEFVKV